MIHHTNSFLFVCLLLPPKLFIQSCSMFDPSPNLFTQAVRFTWTFDVSCFDLWLMTLWVHQLRRSWKACAPMRVPSSGSRRGGWWSPWWRGWRCFAASGHLGPIYNGPMFWGTVNIYVINTVVCRPTEASSHVALNQSNCFKLPSKSVAAVSFSRLWLNDSHVFVPVIEFKKKATKDNDI